MCCDSGVFFLYRKSVIVVVLLGQATDGKAVHGGLKWAYYGDENCM